MTLPKLELHPEAIDEARGARLWYAERDPAIAQAFAAELDALSRQLLINRYVGPATWAAHIAF